MGLLLKIAIITFLILFVIIKVGNFVFRTVFWMLGTEATRRQQQGQPRPNPAQRQARKGEVRVDYVPEQEAQRRQNGFQGGEYVDYEEVK